MKLARFRFQLLVLLVGQLLCRAWDLRELLAPDAPVVSVAVWEPSASSASAFLAVPRVWRDPRNRGDDQASAAASTGRGVEHTLTYHHDGPTLLAAPWPEPGHRRNSTGVRARRVSAPPRPFPRMDEQVLADRESLQSVTAVAVERGRGAARLWVLDTGEVPSHSLARCPPKVVVYNLRGNNQRVWTRPFDGVEGSAVSGLAVDAHAGDTRAYVGYPGAPGGSSLIVLSWRSKAFWLLRLHGVEAPLLPLQPKGPRGRRVPKPTGGSAAPSCWDLAVLKATGRRPRLALAPRSSRGVFDLGLEPLRATLDPERKNDAKGQASELGVRRLTNRPGPSCGLLADAQGGLLYFLVLADGGAVMRWSARSGASSQGHAVVYQDNATLPLSTALFLDTAGAAWAACATFALHHYHDPDLDSDPGIREQSPNRRAHDDDVHGRSISDQDTDDGRDYDQDFDFDDDENLPRRCVCDDYDFDRNDGKDQSRRGDNRDRSLKNRGPGSNPSVLYDFRNSSKSSGKSEKQTRLQSHLPNTAEAPSTPKQLPLPSSSAVEDARGHDRHGEEKEERKP